MSIEINELENGGSITVATKGHVDPQKFVEAYGARSGDPKDDWPSIEEVHHVYMRKTPRDGYESWWTQCEKGRGAFPATIMGPF
ncbi:MULTISPECIES: hypothetical protein [Halomonadaceae]|uniref:Uncharacterized protein n=1 Tax=Vreelandella titanicae TaxID=664683 RepID=A0AAP9T183_9GAMM|nr:MULTISPECIES: hypothetical protein [Halomonas]QKS24231.1 hypothetical protein FX987_02005 [Halomonas titanicae]CDG54525.1 hypothetical protein HALA3H3_790004 [Halomonas sp. A3H3]SDI31306.1 hypothetical protein SAMN04487867_104225 [Halomonas titanicae]